MDVSFVIPVFNHLGLTQECIASLLETVDANVTSFEVVLVDDGSDPATSQGLQELAAGTGSIRLIRNSSNRGYAHSNNKGALEAKGKWLVLANNDLRFEGNWLGPMLDAFKRIDKLGLAGNIQRSVATGEIDHAGAFISPKGTVSHRREANKGLLRTPDYTACKMVTGACCLISRDLFMEVGGFDESFVNGGEDVDLCLRLDRLGYKIVVANKSVILHHVSATRREPNINDERNSRLLQRRWGETIAHLAASRWPDIYLKQVKAEPHIRAIDSRLLREALSRFLLLKKGPAKAALYNAYCEHDRNERHWKSTLDGWTDDMIKDDERQKHATPLKDRYEYDGLHTYPGNLTGVWIRERASVSIPRGLLVSSVSITGHLYPENEFTREEHGKLGLAIKVNDAASCSEFPIESGDFRIEFDKAPARAEDNTEIEIKLLGVERSNTYAFLGRKWENVSIIPARIRKHFAKYRPQRLNKRLAIHSIQINGEDVFNFAKDSTNPLNTDHVLKHAQLGINLVGWFKAELGIGESARLAAKAVKASALPYSFVPLKANCLASQGDHSLDGELGNKNPHPVNVFHIDAPQSPDIDHCHGAKFREGKYNIAYWAWELPDFPDNWTKYFRYFDEIWTPSHFVSESIGMKSPLPVITMPHCIDFKLPERDYRSLLGLPEDKFLFTFAYDLNSYQERKNPRAAIEAFRKAFSGTDLANDVGLVIKVHSKEGNPDSYKELLELLDGLPNYYLIDRTLSRELTYGLMAACDSYLSLHRAEGFGLTVAESMFLEKPVISTNWSATSEFVNRSNGCPVDYELIKLTQNHGPYKKGQLWADPDTNHAAELMQNLVRNPELAQQLGKEAKRTIQGLFSPERIGNLYMRRLRSIALW